MASASEGIQQPTPRGPGVYADIAVDVPARGRQVYSYLVPLDLAVVPGQLVWVPLGHQLRRGVVLGLTTRPPVEFPKPIHGLVAPEPLLDQPSLELARWIADRYLCSTFDALALFFPPGITRRMEVVVELTGEPAIGQYLTPRQRALLEYLRQHRRATLDDLRSLVRQGVSTVVDQLVRKGLVRKHSAPERPRVRAKVIALAELTSTPAEALERIKRMARRSPRADVVERLAADGAVPADVLPAAVVRMLAQRGWIAVEDDRAHFVRLTRPVDEAIAAADEWRGIRSARAVVERLARGAAPVEQVRRESGISSAGWSRLLRDGIVRIRPIEIRRDPLAGRPPQPADPPALTVAQANAYQAIAQAIAARVHRVFLLHGVTGSGKTEVYLRALAEVVARGRQGIVLVPEIALTPQTIDRFNSRFPGRVAVLHSQLSTGEQYDEWRRIAAGGADVVVGTRSAVFAPVPRLGLIVVDEEHERTYKQQEHGPSYHAREVAVKRGELTGAVVVLGSATPDVTSYYRASQGEYTLLEIPERVPQPGEVPTPLPPVEIVDLRRELQAGNRSIFSRTLQRAIATALAHGEQVILFLNRRGTASVVLCRDCGTAVLCRRCEVPLAYHAAESRLICHLCNARVAIPTHCPACLSQRIRYLGIGTQKVVDEVVRLFPDARPIRWDRDATRGRHAHAAILDRFLAREANVLVGTQMIAKGLDLPFVTVVGVILADIGLHLPDYRSGERTFQLLTQVAGRAGRGPAGGQVIVQTYAPENYAIVAAARHDYATFYEREIAFRRRLEQPPFADLVRLLYTSSSQTRCQQEAGRVAALARAYVVREGIADVAVLGPAPAYFHRPRGRYRWQVILRGHHLAEVVQALDLQRDWSIDVDPVSLL